MSTAVVTTTINNRPASYVEYAKQADEFIVAGDVSTPTALAAYVRELGGVYLSPDEQHSSPLCEPWSDTVGWKSIQRRNAAVIEAYARGHDVIITVDDDNLPVTDFVASHEVRLGSKVVPGMQMARSELGGMWINIGDYVYPKTWQRGTPYGATTASVLDRVPNWYVGRRIGIAQSHVLGAPDCDAITRLVDDPEIIIANEEFVVNTHQSFCAFNSQATAYTRDLAPLIGVLPGIGRYDDIFASFIAQTLMNALTDYVLFVGTPHVVQERNVHDLIQDLRGEVFGLRTTYDFTTTLRENLPQYRSEDTLADAYDRAAHHLTPHLPEQTIAFMRGWAKAWKGLL